MCRGCKDHCDICAAGGLKVIRKNLAADEEMIKQYKEMGMDDFRIEEIL